MTIWEILKIDKTTDKRAIKRAYARALKYTHPEDDPAAFQRLKEAFDLALECQEFNQDISIPFSEADNILNIEKSEVEKINLEMDLSKQRKENIVEERELSFKERINEVYTKYKDRIDIEVWRGLFQSESAFNMDTYEENKYFLANFLAEKGCFIPKNIINLAFELYNLNEIVSDDPNIRLAVTLREVKNLPPFQFEALQDLEENEQNTFIMTRFSAYKCLERKGIQSHIKRAKAIFDKDPDLELIEIITRTGKLNMNTILKEINSFIERNPEHSTARMYRLFLNKKLNSPINYADIDYAISETYFSIPRENDFFDEIIFHVDKNRLLGLIYFDLKEYTTAYNYLINASDTSGKAIRDRITYCLKLKLKQEKASSSTKSKINDIRKELSFYSLLAYERVYLKTRKKNLLLMLLFATGPASLITPWITDNHSRGIWSNYWLVYSLIFVISGIGIHILFRRELWLKYRDAERDQYYQNKK
ncbi:molecular chaperone DnaJ [Listeria seeligeri]|uniref:molecular chaperone DnaJ n=1 Tax=Listeria seeligeri TaxID=1640 RepID=UPI001625754C|nr:molecular chaperone DnaJ [Listeria seeligeri]MBC1421371.1 molecular chaperone DnaJ [Listeria seeligeri]MBC1751144.1 molecular chaperone DnaJ [Listeria seeligeri]MBC1829564.1 molecular chaperone DnaJ [Listeria seeligeri]MBC1843767.1 molecular chaperone DnaJ [Listeria seeligeri]MBF2655684.1 molecular chaperone DnaJ [Listeria seeligeri]